MIKEKIKAILSGMEDDIWILSLLLLAIPFGIVFLVLNILLAPIFLIVGVISGIVDKIKSKKN